MTAVIESVGLGRRYGKHWALRDCTVRIPAGKVAGLVGPNGAGKSTLLHLAVGLLSPSAGRITVVGGQPGSGQDQLSKVGFVAQDTPVYGDLSVANHLRMGQYLNTRWDGEWAARRVRHLGMDPRQRAGSLSGGQRAQLALVLAVAKRPRLLILDEPAASLDPLARRGFLESLTEIAAREGVSVVLSSHLLADLERACDYVVVLAGSRVCLVGEVPELLAEHKRVSAPRRELTRLSAGLTIIQEDHNNGESVVLVKTHQPVLDPAWPVTTVSLEDLVLAYLTRSEPSASSARPRREMVGR